MGRPIQKKYFANTNVGRDGEGVGGEQFSALYVLTTGTLYSTTTNYTWVASNPQIAGGQPANGTVSIRPDGGVSAFNFIDGGSGYTSTSSVTVTISPSTTGTTATYVVNLTSASRVNGLAIYAYIPASGTAGLVDGSGGTQRLLGDVVRQVGSNKYMVRTSEGLGKVKLVSDGVANAAGEADLTATDSSGKTYYVMKLNGRKAKLKQYGSSGWQFADESWVKWVITSATLNETVLLANA